MNIPSRDGLILTDGKVTIRPYQLDDVEGLLAAARESVETIYPWLPWCHPAYSRSESETWVNTRSSQWSEGREFDFVIVDPATDRFVGALGLNHLSDEFQMANLGYWVRRTEMGKGYTPAATRLLARFGFEQVGLQRIEILAATGNSASQRVAEKAGACREGVLRHRLVLRGEAHDAVLYSFIASDFSAESAT